MKKILALILTVIMVASMVPAMTLVSSADEPVQLKLKPYQKGAETWCTTVAGTHGNGFITQFVVEWRDDAQTSGTKMADFLKELGYVDATGSEDAKWNANVKWNLKVTGLDGKTEELECAPTSLYNGGTWGVIRFGVNKEKAVIQVGNTYTLDISISVGGVVKYTGTSTNHTWATPDKQDTCTHGANGEGVVHGIEVGGIDFGTEGAAKFDSATANDPYENPISVEWITYNNVWLEKHDTWGRVLLVGFDSKLIPAGGDSGENEITKATVRITIDGKTKIVTKMAPGYEFFEFGDNTIYRIPYTPMLPTAGEYEDVLIEFVRKSDNKVMFTGTTTITSPGDPDAEKTTVTTEIKDESVAAGGKFDVTYKLNNVPTSGVNGWQLKLVYDPALVTPVSYTAPTLEGKTVYAGMNATTGEIFGTISAENGKGVENYTENFALGTVTFQANFKAEVGSTAAIDAEVVELYYTNSSEPYEVDIECVTTDDTITITEAEAKLGDVNGDTKINKSDVAQLARYVAKWSGVTVEQANADVTNDGKINKADVAALARHVAKWSDYAELPYEG